MQPATNFSGSSYITTAEPGPSSSKVALSPPLRTLSGTLMSAKSGICFFLIPQINFFVNLVALCLFELNEPEVRSMRLSHFLAQFSNNTTTEPIRYNG